jgi:hypothetical protein
MSQAFSAQASFHRYRLDVIAAWPESDCKRAALAAAEAAFQGELAFERAASMRRHHGGPSGPRL